MSVWRPVSDPPAEAIAKVLLLASNPNHCFGHPVPLAGHYTKEAYGVRVDWFKPTAVTSGWTVTHWMYLPEEANKRPPSP